MKIKDQWTGGLLQPFALVSGQFEFYWLFLVERSDAGYKQRVTGTDDTKMALYGPRCAIKRKSKRRNPEGGGGSENGEREKKREKERKREKKREKERRIIRPSTRPLLPAFWLAISLGRFHKPQARGDRGGLSLLWPWQVTGASPRHPPASLHPSEHRDGWH